MDIITKEDLKTLSEITSDVCISFFLPTHRTGKETEQDPIRFKNLLRDVEKRLLEKGIRRPDVENILKPAQNLLQKSGFWSHLSDGLAVYISSEKFQTYRLPISLDELIVISTGFHLKPLLPFFARDGHFYILALSQNQVRLLEGTRHSVDEVDVEEAIPTMSEAMQFERYYSDIQFRSGSSASQRGESAGMFHGHDPSDDDKNRLLRWFHKIDDELSPFFAVELSPVILAGVDYLFPIYKEANSFPHIVDEGIPGNPEELSAMELHEKAWPIIRPIFSKLEEEAHDQYFELKAKEKTSNAIDEIVPAAVQGRIDTIFVAVGEQIWGSYNKDNFSIRVLSDRQSGDEDLLNLAAIQTFLNGGTVYAVEADKVPGGEKLAAIFRY